MSQVDEEPRAAVYERRAGAGPTLRIRRNVIQRALWERASVFTETSSSDVAEGENIMCVPLIGVQNTIGTIYLTSRGLTARTRGEPCAVLELCRWHRCRYFGECFQLRVVERGKSQASPGA